MSVYTYKITRYVFKVFACQPTADNNRLPQTHEFRIYIYIHVICYMFGSTTSTHNDGGNDAPMIALWGLYHMYTPK